jgi:CTP:molybdopterin cytidylyltransferase MocA
VFKQKLGFIQRLENAAAAIPEGIRQAQIAILERQRSADQAQANVGKPFKHAEQLADAIALKARIEAQLNHDQQTPQAASVSAHLAAAEAALQGPPDAPSTAPATYERPPAAARPAGLRIG